MAADKNVHLQSVGDDGYVSAEDVLFLRENVFQDGIVDRAELNAVFELGERAPDGDPEWLSFFGEVCADFFLCEEEPNGYLTDAEFMTIKALVVRDGAKASRLEVSVLVSLIEKAVSIPRGFSEFTGDQLVRWVSERDGGPKIDEQDAALLRRYLYAVGGAGATAITKDEAELLFDIHDLTAQADNHASWNDLFIKAIAAHLMQYVGYQPLPREEALRLHEWVKDHSVNPGGFFNRMFSGGLSAIREAYGRKSIRAQRNEEDEIAIAIAEQVTAREADWLADRISRDGVVDDTERALIAYMRELEADLPPKLQALVENAA